MWWRGNRLGDRAGVSLNFFLRAAIKDCAMRIVSQRKVKIGMNTFVDNILSAKIVDKNINYTINTKIPLLTEMLSA